jgi:rfaE bifunctional protein kinase chain/domain/rfaE bifunctional protein nucleotidyltransferase chain/domain
MDSRVALLSDLRGQPEEAATEQKESWSNIREPRSGRAGPTGATAQKIKDLEELAALLNEVRANGRRIVHCHGVFDLLHIGHIRHFEAAKQHGDVLVVTLTPDKYVNKGPHRPAFPQDLRAEMIASLGCVDYVAVNAWPMGVETIKLLRPHVFAKGQEFREGQDVTGAIPQEEEAIRSVGGQIVFTEDITFSSSNLINRHLSVLPKDASAFLSEFAGRHSADDLIRYLDGARSLKVLLVGETIIDEYNYCETLGKSGKEPILAVRFCSSEKFAGGILAVGNHVASFCDRVSLLSFLGQEDSHEAFIREKLDPRVHANFFYMSKAPTIVKRRYIENYPFQKMFEVYQMNEDENEAANEERLCRTLEEVLPRYNLVIVADYGHGMFTPRVIDLLSREARCLAVNTQANAGNHGFNTVSKYPRANYVCVSESEIRLEARSRREDLRRIIQQVAEKLGCQQLMVTRGQQGMLCYSKEDGFVEAPALATHFADRVGAGDAVFAITSLCMVQDAPAEIMAVIGNAVGAMSVGTVGNRTPINRTALIRSTVSLLK